MSDEYPHNLHPVTSCRAAPSEPEVIGPGIEGIVRPGGTDWLTVRPLSPAAHADY